MNKVSVVFGVMVLVILLGLVIEVLNPHSFLQTMEAFVRVIILLVSSVVWVWYSKKNNTRLLVAGSILLLLSACAYLWYGINSYCGQAYWEETDHYQKVTAEYSCTRLLKEHLLQSNLQI